MKHIPRIKIEENSVEEMLIFWFHHQATLIPTKSRNHLHQVTLLLHVADAINCGTINKLEGSEAKWFYETNNYLPSWVTVRDSNYSDRI